MFAENECDAQACQTVDVHRQLEGGEMVACQKSEDAIEAGELVEDEGKRDQRSASRKWEGEEEGLKLYMLAFPCLTMRSRHQAFRCRKCCASHGADIPVALGRAGASRRGPSVRILLRLL